MWTQQDANTRNEILVIGNGQQPPYGDGELIQTFPATRKGMQKARNLADQWYNKPFIIQPEKNENR